MNKRVPLLGAAAGLVAVVAATGIAAADTTQSAQSTRASAIVTTKALSAEAGTRAAEASLRAAEKAGYHVTVVVIDRAGTVRVLLHGDGAGPQTEDSARRKAFTAVSFGQPTSVLAGRVTAAGATLRDLPGTLFLAGGIPVVSDGQPIAAIGVGGAPSGDLDESFARAGLEAVASRL